MGIEATVAKFCVQTCVYWECLGPDGFGGQSFSEPVELSCRWDGIQELNIDDTKQSPAAEIISNAKVLLTQDVKLSSYLWLGFIANLPTEIDNPVQIPQAYQVTKFVKTPMVRKTNEFVRTAYV
jgi:hypothetical protein